MEIQQKAEILADFIGFCKETLNIESLPKIQFISDNSWAKNNRSFGQYNILTKSLIVYIGNRNLGDICRTLSHELVHHKQNELGLLNNMSGETGSDTENQANSIAGICLRNYGKIEPLIYESINKVTNNGKRNKSKKGIL
jgi:Zn-dependent peptidase ImmA (M78 family)